MKRDEAFYSEDNYAIVYDYLLFKLTYFSCFREISLFDWAFSFKHKYFMFGAWEISW